MNSETRLDTREHSVEANGSPTIAIVIATYNGGATLEACLDSLSAQSVRPSEVIVQDGGSTDDTCAILARRSREITTWTSEPDDGVYDAWNRALRHVTADWVWFLGCDDQLASPDTVARVSSALLSVGDARLVSSRVAMVDGAGDVVEIIGSPWAVAQRSIGFRMSVPHTGLLTHRSLLGSNPFDVQYRIAGDYEWFLRASGDAEVAFLDMVTVHMGDAGLSGRTSMQIQTYREYGRILHALGRPRPLQWRFLLATAWVKSLLQQVLGTAAQSRVVDAYRVLTFRRPRRRSR